MNSFLLKPRWMILHISALCLAILFTNFGFWQLRRLDQRQARNNTLEQRLSEPPEALKDLLERFSLDAVTADAKSIALRPTFTTGRYDVAEEVLLRTADNYNEQPGYYVLTPLILDSGEALLVKRGWVPFDLNVPPIKEAIPITDNVDLEGFLLERQTEPTGWVAGLAPKNPEGELEITAYLDTERLAEQMPYDLLPIVLELTKQSPEQEGVFPQPNKAPSFSNGSHLGYAIQWFSFALIGVIGYTILMMGLVRERKKQAG